MIKNITTEGFKGQDLSVELSGLDLITGPNGSGKTSVLQALEFAIHGKIGTVTKNAEIIAEFSAKDIKTVLRGHDFMVSRELTAYMKKGELKIDHNLLVQSGTEYESSLKKGAELIEQNLYISPLVFNFSEFINKSAADRRKYIMDLVGNTDLTTDELIDYVLKNYLDNGDDWEDYEIEIFKKAVTNLAGNLETMGKIAETNFKRWNSEQKETSAASRKIADIKSDLKTNISLKGDLVSEKQLLAEQVQTLRDEYAKMKQHNEQVIQNDDHSERVMLAMKSISERDFDAEIKAIQSTIDQETKVLIKLIPQEEIDHLKIVLGGHEANLDLLNIEIKGIKEAMAAQSFKLAELNSLINTNTDKLAETTAGNCPMTGMTCTADLTEYKSNLQLAVDAAEKDKEVITGIIKEYQDQLYPLEHNLIEVNERISWTKTKLTEINYLNNVSSRKNYDVSIAVQKLKTDIELLQRDQLNVKSRLSEYQQELNSIPAMVKYSDEELEKIKAKGVHVNEELQAIENKLTDIVKKNQMLDAEIQAVEDAKIAAAYFKAWKEIKRLVGPKGIQGDIINNNLGPVKDKITNLFGLFGFNELNEAFYFSLEDARGNQKFDFGVDCDHGRKGFAALSKSEQIITALCMTIAMQSYMPDKLRVLLIDEVNNLFGERLNSLLSGLCELVKANEYDNVIVAGSIYLDKVNTCDFNVIEL